jgi:alpha-tubulin suppressor-like RCC1 family protein
VVLNDGRVHYFINHDKWSRGKKQSGSFTIKDHSIQSIASGFKHSVMVTMEGAVFGFGRNNVHQLGMVDPSALSSDTVSMPTEVFAEVTKFKRDARLPDGKELQRPGIQQS